jgi:hypothetical protein
MDWSRWMALAVVGLYAIVVGGSLLLNGEGESLTSQDLFYGFFGGCVWLAMSLGCIWWGDELGEGLVGAKFGLVSVSGASPSWAVKLLGWVLLLLPAALVLYWEWTARPYRTCRRVDRGVGNRV